MPQVLHGQFRLGKLRQRGDLITRRQVAQMVGTITPDESGIPLPWVVLTASGFTVLQVLGVVSDICYG